MTMAAFSPARLERMRAVMGGHVAKGAVPGYVSLLWRRGETVLDVAGTREFGGAPMRRDTIFRITSMTKPIVAAAAMILVEECVLRLDDPVAPLLPELAAPRVLTRIDADLSDTVPAARAITLRDLLTFRLGTGAIFGPPDLYPIQKAIAALGIVGFGPPDQATPLGPDEWLRRLATLPLLHQPGESWMYNIASMVLGILIARAAGKPLEDFLRERIFAPLGMKDTGFSVPRQKLDRLAASYWANQKTGALDLNDGIDNSKWIGAPAFPDGGAGLVSTVDDYLAFARMMLDKGKSGAGRILSRPAVELMLADHLTEAQKSASAWFPGMWANRGWGMGVLLFTGRDDIWAAPGRFGWDGGYGTSWYCDPGEAMIGLLMTQRAEFPLFNPVWRDFWTSAYQALDD
jgi:CubicO group peptidase (beta-lactamase class C family)